MVPLPPPLRRLPAWPPRTREAGARGRASPPRLGLVRAERADLRGGGARAGQREPRAGGGPRRAGDRGDVVSRRSPDLAGVAGGFAGGQNAPHPPSLRRSRRGLKGGSAVGGGETVAERAGATGRPGGGGPTRIAAARGKPPPPLPIRV